MSDLEITRDALHKGDCWDKCFLEEPPFKQCCCSCKYQKELTTCQQDVDGGHQCNVPKGYVCIVCDLYHFSDNMHSVGCEMYEKTKRKDDPDETKSMDAIKPPDHPEGDSESDRQDMEILAAISRLEEMRKEKRDG